MPVGTGLAGQVGWAQEVYTNEVQTLTGTPSVPFSLTFDGATTTGTLATNASAVAIQNALNALPNVGATGVVCTGGALPSAVTVTFSGPQVAGRNVPTLIVNLATGLAVATPTPGTGYGDVQTPTRFLEVVSAKPVLNMDKIVSKNLRAGNLTHRSDRWYPNKKGASVDVVLEVPNKGLGVPLQQVFGAAPVITTPTNGVLTRRHRYIFANPLNFSQDVQVGVPTILGDANNVKPFTYVGAKVAEAAFDCALDGLLLLSLKYDAKDELTSQALAAASFAAAVDLFPFTQGAVTLGGANRDVTKLNVSVKTNMAMDRRFISLGAGKKEQLVNDFRDLTGLLTIEFADTYAYSLFANTTQQGSLAPITITFTGQQIENVASPGPYFYQLVFTMPICRIEGTTPTVDSNDLVTVDVPFTMLTDGTLEPLTLDVFTTDTVA